MALPTCCIEGTGVESTGRRSGGRVFCSVYDGRKFGEGAQAGL
jgi:hypothetical protein